MNEFIKTQQEFARGAARQCNEKPVDEKIEDCFAMTFEELDTLIQQIITNTGEELLRKCDKEIMKADKFVPFQAIHYKSGIDTIKQHITSLTGVE